MVDELVQNDVMDEKLDHNSVMNEDLVQKGVIDGKFVKNFVMNAKMIPEVVMDVSIFWNWWTEQPATHQSKMAGRIYG